MPRTKDPIWNFSRKLLWMAHQEQSLVLGVTSAAGLERHFSTLGMTYGRLRGQLEPEKAGKLAFLYRQYNCLQKFCFELKFAKKT